MISTVAVIGQGYVGLPLAIAAASVGYRVLGIEVNEERFNKLKNSISPIEDISNEEIFAVASKGAYIPESELKAVSEAKIVVICVPTPLHEDGTPDLRPLMEVIEAIRFSVSDETLIISESTSYPGTLRNIIRSEICSRAREKKLKFAVAPERVDPGNKSFSLKNTPRVVGALDQESLEEALSFYQDFCDEVIPVSSAEVAETAKLLENSFRLVNISFVNEVDTYCSKLGITTREVIEAASTKPFGYMPFFPGIGIGGHCIPIDPMYLSYHAESIGADMKLINLSKRIDNERTERVAKFIKQNNSGNLPITLIGLGYKSGTSDTRESPSIRILNLLRHYNFSVDWIDSQVLEWNGETSKREVLGMAVLIREDEAFNVAEHIRKGKPCIDCTGTYGHIKGVTSISI